MDIRPFHRDDSSALCSWFADEAQLTLWDGFMTEPALSHPLSTQQIQRMLNETQGNKPKRLIFSASHNHELAAHAQIMLDWKHGIARLVRVVINPAYRGQHLAQPFLKQIIEKFFDKQEFSRLELNVFTCNRFAVQTFRKLGFQLEGIRRSCLQAGNERLDTAILAMLRSDIQTPCNFKTVLA